MSAAKKLLLIVLLGAMVASFLWVRHLKRRTITITGAVITSNPDPRKQLPIAGVSITAEDGVSQWRAVSDSSGLFALTIRRRLLQQHPTMTLLFRHPDYEPLDIKVPVSEHISVASMKPVLRAQAAEDSALKQSIANVVVRYSMKTRAEVNVGSAVRSFEAVNKGSVPCNGQLPCSPDGKWKAGTGSVSLDAGVGNEFRNARASCIAGPCPFTSIDMSGLEPAGQRIGVSAVAWSDTATFLVEAEVVHPMVSDIIRNLYPVIFGDTLNFTLPAMAQGVSIQAEVNGQTIVFPVGPLAILSWANCNVRTNPDETHVYRCELKPGYRWLNSGT